ncbi:MAG: NAD(P)/FAD-dependent oxidoreductase [Actinomycetales bacterium]|nr:NAD(P)/FAD-dependent oxidoreductase [Actinomycetales bacterium]
MSADADLLVVGGGPVGLAAAIEARLAGLEVLIAEPREGPIDKACGEGLLPGALPALARLGVDPRGAELRGVVYRDAHHEVRHDFTDGPGRGVRRTTLHAALAARARELGARTVPLKVTGVDRQPDGVTAHGQRHDDCAPAPIRARWLIAADGLHSAVARSLGLARPAPRPRRRFGIRRHYAIPAWNDAIEVHWTPLGELYVTPTADGVVGVALLGRKGVAFGDAVAAAPALDARLRGAEVAGQDRGAGPFRQLTRARTAGRVLLAGDASGYVDAITGEGLRLGLEHARLAVRAVLEGDPARYEADWRRAGRDVRRATRALAFAASTPLHGAVVPLAARLPGLYARAVELIAR